MPVANLEVSQLELPEALDYATKEIDNKLLLDSKFPSIDDQLSVNNYACLSGISDQDYPIVEQAHGVDIKKHLASFKQVPIPDELIELYSHAECNAVMGIFAEVNRAWVSIDSDIYLWRYEDGSDLAFYDGLKEAILAASLVVPKEGVFQDHIRYLLVITTANFISILGVCFAPESNVLFDGSDGAIQLIPEPLFTLSTDKVFLTSICGTDNGRIFLSGKDNSLYEIIYQSPGSWFSRQCYKVNHSTSKMSYIIPSFLSSAFSAYDPICQLAMDNSRGFLYCRTEQGNVKVYNLGENLESMKFFTMLTGTSISKQAQCIARRIIMSNFEKIVHIAPIPKSESPSVCLLAVTDTGVRMYFILIPGNELYGSSSQLRLAHVRMPPGFSPGAITEKPSNIRTAFYRKGISLFVGSLNKDADVLWYFSQEMFPMAATITESQSLVRIDSETWCMAEVPNIPSNKNLPLHLFNDNVRDYPSVATQHILPPRKFILLNTEGSYIITLSRPMEQLRAVLIASRSGESEQLASFFKTYGADQACAICLALICQSCDSEMQLVDLAVSAFFHYGSRTAEQPYPIMQQQHQQQQQQQQHTLRNINSTAVAQNSPQHLSQYIVGSPIQGGSTEGSYLATPKGRDFGYLKTPAPPNLMNTTLPANQVSQPMEQNSTLQSVEPDNKYSSKYNGLLLYFSRTLRPIWNFPMVFLDGDPLQQVKLVSRLRVNELSWFIEETKKIQLFIDEYTGISSLQSPTGRFNFFMNRNQTASPEDIAEKKALQAFSQLIVLTIEAMDLWKLLCEHDFNTIITSKEQDIQAKVLHIPFRDLFSKTGRELSCSLINLLMGKYLNDKSTVETLSDKLRDVCPTIFSADDAVYAKANEMLISTHNTTNQIEKDKLIREAILTYSNVPHLVDLQWVCGQLKSNRAFRSVVQLCLTIALKRDNMGVGLHFFKSGKPTYDLEGMEVFNYRQEAYEQILKTLEELLQSSNSLQMSPSKLNQTKLTVDSTANSQTMKKHFEDMLNEVVESGDEVCHSTLYDWLVRTGQTDRLLQIKSPFIEQFLVSSAAEQHPNNRDQLDLLWKYYEKNSSFIEAAKILTKLAEREESNFTIHDRIEYLSRAVMSAKSCRLSTSASSEGEFLHEVEEKLEVAQVQLQTFNQIVNKKSITKQRRDKALIELNSKLHDISTLYEEYAEEFSLPECKLAIILCANHNDKKLVEKIWQEIISEAFAKCDQLSRADQKDSLREHLSSAIKPYLSHQQYFPLEKIVSQLERHSCEYGWETGFIMNLLLNIGVNISKLFHQYNSIYKTKEKIWQALGKPYHILAVLSELIEKYANEIHQKQTDRYSLARSLYEATLSYLVDLESLNSNADTQTLLQRYKIIQGKLKRML